MDVLAINDELTIRFPIPVANDDTSIFYRIIVETSAGTKVDTTEETSVSQTVMQLVKDRPDISYSATSMGYLRRVALIRPNLVTDNSEIKNVTYNVFNNPSDPDNSIIRSKTVTSPLWQWNWNILNSSNEGLDNGTYYLRMTVNDYAGLSASTYTGVGTEISLTIDNDYIAPVISDIIGTSVTYGANIAKVGESYSISAIIKDSGSEVSAVEEAYVYYKLNDTATTYFIAL